MFWETQFSSEIITWTSTFSILGFSVKQRPVDVSKAEKPKKKVDDEDDDGIIDLMDMEIPDDQEAEIKKTLEVRMTFFISILFL